MAKKELRKFRCSDIPTRCFPFFKKMKSENELCDITIYVGNRCIFAHRVILAAVIPYFRKFLSKNETEGDINVGNIEPDAFTCLIEYAYSCEVIIDANNVKALLAASSFLGIQEVKEACCDFLSDCLEPGSVWSIRELAFEIKCPKLLEDADCYIMENFDVVSQTRDFLGFPLTFLKELVGKDELNVDSEEQVLDAVLRWVKWSPDDRRDKLPELLCTVRIPLIEPRYLAHIFLMEEMIRTSVSCRDIDSDGRNFMFPEMVSKGYSFETKPRQNKKVKFESQEPIDNPCIYVLHAKEIYGVQCIDLLKETRITKEYERINMLSGSAVNLQDKMYFFHLSITLQYDPNSNTYEKMRSMETLRENFGATAVQNEIYVCGGKTSWLQPSNAVECFDPENGEWRTSSSMPTSRWGLSVVTLDEYIFALGGRDNDIVFAAVERYDLKRDKWKSVSSMLDKRRFVGAATLNGKIYACGGADDFNLGVFKTGEVYDPIVDQWAYISPMNSSRWQFTLLSCQGHLYAIGGMDDKFNDVSTLDVYNPERDDWTLGPLVNNSRSISGAVVMEALYM